MLLPKHLVIKTSDKKYERRFERSTVIFKLEFMNKNSAYTAVSTKVVPQNSKSVRDNAD